MDFNFNYTPEHEYFRLAVRGWLAENAPKNLKFPQDGSPLTTETQIVIKEFRLKLGEKGWLAPSWPREIGGGGLTAGYDVVMMEEMRRVELPGMGDNTRWIPAMMVWGTDQQKKRFILPSLQGKIITWQAFNEPESGSDFATVHTKAVPESDGYRITGKKAFITGRFDPDFLVTLAVTDPERPPRYNLGVFMVDARLPGIEIKTMRMLTGSERRVYFNDVFVTSDCLIGPAFQGWEIAYSIIEAERGGASFRFSEDGTMESIYKYLKDQRSEQPD